uniref:Uncharacterized protein n=1 Tax=Romanomermis culicivorax TaxID=13658 RepID=A0A915JDA7_ROMCU
NLNVYLLDDPLSAVDAKVAKFLFDHCIRGLLKSKTVLLVTHHIQFLREADRILMFEDSCLKSHGSKNIADLWLSYWLTNQNSSNVTNLSNSIEKISSDINETPIKIAALIDQFNSKSVKVLVNSFYTASNFIDNPIDGSDQTIFYLKIYALIILSNTFFTLIRSFSFAYGGLKAAKNLHSMLLQRVLKAPCQFFDATPLGRIINRFSADIWCIDDSLPFQANIFVMFVFAVVGTITMTCYGLPWFIVAVVPIMFVYYEIQKYYRRTTCELKRLNTVSLSPIFGQFSNTLNGLTVIKAFKRSTIFVEKFHSILTGNQMAEYSLLACSMWLNVRIQSIGIFMIICVVIIVVVEHEYRSVNAGLVGLAISYALSVTGIFNGLLTSFTETEKELISVERVSDYIENVPQEKNESTVDPPETWPNGGIVFSKVNLRYVKSAPLALRNLNLEIFVGEKIGIVGRTGSGKSSIFQALFRTTDVESGSVVIDNIDISTISLETLRISTNNPNYLLPGLNVDARLDWVVKKCSLESVVTRLVDGLDGNVGERGQSLSVGERQLVCLARALLIGSKIVCIDEATAHIDIETDAKIQKAIKEGFPQATMLTIAHRLNTVMDYDRIMVMDGGGLLEFDAPRTLLSDKNSYFSNLARIAS